MHSFSKNIRYRKYAYLCRNPIVLFLGMLRISLIVSYSRKGGGLLVRERFATGTVLNYSIAKWHLPEPVYGPMPRNT